MMLCSDCGADLHRVEVGAPCPGCGGMSRSATAPTGVATVGAMAGEVGLTVTKGDHRPWTEKWRYVLQCREAIAETTRERAT